METVVLALIIAFLIYDKRFSIHDQYLRLRPFVKNQAAKIYNHIGKCSSFSVFKDYDYSYNSFVYTNSGFISGLNITGSITSNPATGSVVIYNGTSWQPISSSIGSYSKQDYDDIKQDYMQIKTELADLKSKLNKYFGDII